MEDKKFYIYAWFFKDSGEIFHVGKGTGSRYKETKISRNQYFKNIINAYPDNVDVKILQDNLTEEEAFELERQTIKEYKAIGECKTNFHEGGCGGNTGNYDSPERSHKLSEAAKKRVGKLNPMYGKTHSEKVRQILSEKNKGKHLSPEHIEKLKEANKGRKKSAEELQFISKLNKGKRLSKDTYDKMMNSLCPYEYQIWLNGELLYSCLGHSALYSYCKNNLQISRTIVDQVVNNTWKPKFLKHQNLTSLKILKIKRCID